MLEGEKGYPTEWNKYPYAAPVIRRPRFRIQTEASELILNALPMKHRMPSWVVNWWESYYETHGYPKKLWERIKPVLSINGRKPNVVFPEKSFWEDWWSPFCNVRVVGYVS